MKIVRKLGLLGGLLLFWINVNGQPSTGDPNQGAKPGEAPISGIEILIGLGGLLGAKKLFDARKKK